MIKQSQNWYEFLKKMADLGYEIKHDKHISFKHKDIERFMQEYSSSKSEMTELCQIRKNYEKYMEKEMER